MSKGSQRFPKVEQVGRTTGATQLKGTEKAHPGVQTPGSKARDSE